MNCRRTNARYTYLRTVLTIGVASLPKGNAWFPFAIPGVPTRSMITLVVSQNAAVVDVSDKFINYLIRSNLPSENHASRTENML